METNWTIIILVIIAVFVLMAFIIKRNKKDKYHTHSYSIQPR